MSKHRQGRRSQGWVSGRAPCVHAAMLSAMQKGTPMILKAPTHTRKSAGWGLPAHWGAQPGSPRKGPQPPVVPGEGASPLTRKHFQGWTHRRGVGGGQRGSRAPAEAGAATGRYAGPRQPLPGPRPARPRPGGLHNPAGRPSAPGERGRRRGRPPRSRGRSSPTRPGARVGPGQRPPPPPGARRAPGLSVSGPGAHTTPETNTQTP